MQTATWICHGLSAATKHAPIETFSDESVKSIMQFIYSVVSAVDGTEFDVAL